MPLNADEVRQIAALSRLQIGVEEADRWALQLAAIVDHVVRLAAADAGPAEEAAARTLPERADAVAPRPAREGWLESAPERFQDYFAVPRVFGP
jgi:aspartyl/glutamyl-tRNA(Asn/Gln) amidotransferase C subunit